MRNVGSILDKLTMPPLLNEIPINQSPLISFVLADSILQSNPLNIFRTEEKDNPKRITPIRSVTLSGGFDGRRLI
jgi:hypothetical protein